MVGCVRILVSRHSAFYVPLIVTIGGPFLEQEGLTATYNVKPANRGSFDILASGEVDIVQAAVSSNWHRMEQGRANLPMHFAQINRRDGFWITSREPIPFRWKHLEGKTFLVDHGPQPIAMLRYVLDLQGVNWKAVNVIDAGNPTELDAMFREGKADYVHQQGPAAQKLENDGIGYVVASVGEAMPPVAFSSLMASTCFLKTPAARSFMSAYRKALVWIDKASAGAVATTVSPYFPEIEMNVLIRTIADYKKIGCWSDNPAIQEAEYDQALEVFLASGAISKRHAFSSVVGDVLT